MNDVIDRPRIAAEPSRVPGAGAVLTPDALDLVAELHERFDGRREMRLPVGLSSPRPSAVTARA